MNYKNISGWYYDWQAKNPITKVTLHYNQKLVEKKDEKGKVIGSTWVALSDDEKDPDDKESPEPTVRACAYSKKPLCSSIAHENFNVSVANTWSEFGADPIGDMWNTVRPLAPYAKELFKGLGKLVENHNEEMANNKEAKTSWIGETLSKVVTKINEFQNSGKDDMIVDYMNRSLVVQGTRFSYYAGTGVAFGNLVMKFTLFPKWQPNGTFTNVYEQAAEIYPYIMGSFESEEMLKDTVFADFVKWQKPPGGFKSDMKNVDNVQEGTLKLKIGINYSIPNLVCEGAALDFSKQMVKDPTRINIDKGEGTSGFLSPLYCDVVINLRPATKFSDKSLIAFVSGSGVQVTRTKHERMMIDNLKSLKSGLDKEYEKYNSPATRERNRRDAHGDMYQRSMNIQGGTFKKPYDFDMAEAAAASKKADKISKGVESHLDILGFTKKLNSNQ